MSSKTGPKKVSPDEVFVLEELFLDQLIFKLSAIFDLYTIQKEHKNELNSFIERLKTITHENLKLLKK